MLHLLHWYIFSDVSKKKCFVTVKKSNNLLVDKA
jgi:hypothetical protein